MTAILKVVVGVVIIIITAVYALLHNSGSAAALKYMKNSMSLL